MNNVYVIEKNDFNASGEAGYGGSGLAVRKAFKKPEDAWSYIGTIVGEFFETASWRPIYGADMCPGPTGSIELRAKGDVIRYSVVPLETE